MDPAEIAPTLWCVLARQMADGSCFPDGRRCVIMAGGFDIRCSVIVFRKQAVLLVHRTHDGLDDWVLPGGTPREGESAAACARRELLEETGVSADPSRIALVAESVAPGSSHRLLDIVFFAGEPVLGREQSREPGLEPHFVPPDDLAGLVLHPSLAGHLLRLLDPGVHEYAPYVGNVRQQSAVLEPRPKA
jgi:8-oxo-dGTP diphosphatase